MTPSESPRAQGLRSQMLKDGTRDAGVSQRAILEAATAEFSARGLEGARVDQIASAAGINKQLLYRYFGSKDDLYLRVLEDIYFRFRGEERELGLATMAPDDAIRTFIGSMVERLHKEHHFARLVIDENFHEARHLKHSARVRDLHAELLATIEHILKRGHKAGIFRKGIDALQLFTSIASLSTFYVTNMYTLSALFGERFDRLHHTPTITAHIQDMVLGFLSQDPTAFRNTRSAARPKVRTRAAKA